ncbi:hypothetical protein LCGC14_0437040 [marine sediment metagenome]|uniref:DnaA N-terminal domain-containing protein n=1 Tax=marine sediment metagenome TaxID=412755 RepID=A0A0F9SLI7_9ZZZZ
MSRAWVPMFADEWPEIADTIPRPWPEAAVGMDLRWWSNEQRMGRKGKPGRSALVQRWGWTAHKVRTFIASGAWEDGITSESPEVHQPTASESPAPTSANLHNGAETSSESPADRQKSASESPHARRLTTEKLTTEPLNKGKPSRDPSPPVQEKCTVKLASGQRFPEAVRRAAVESGQPKGEILDAVNAIAEFICERKIGADDGDAVVRAWRELGHGFIPVAHFRREAMLIARACKESMHDRFKRDVRGEGWAGKSDASKSVSSVLRVSAGNGAGWSERLFLAEKHAEEIDGRSRPAPALTPVDGDGDLTVPMQSSDQPVWLDTPTPGEWTFARGLLRKQFREDFTSWFNPVKLGGVSDGLVVLECTKTAVKVLSGADWLPAIEAALGANVAFRVVPWAAK